MEDTQIEVNTYIAAAVFVWVVDFNDVQNGRLGGLANFHCKVVRVQRVKTHLFISDALVCQNLPAHVNILV